jgi:hypothetical protein
MTGSSRNIVVHVERNGRLVRAQFIKHSSLNEAIVALTEILGILDKSPHPVHVVHDIGKYTSMGFNIISILRRTGLIPKIANHSNCLRWYVTGTNPAMVLAPPLVRLSKLELKISIMRSLDDALKDIDAKPAQAATQS